MPRNGGAGTITEIENDPSLLKVTPGNLSKDRRLNAIRYALSEIATLKAIDQSR